MRLAATVAVGLLVGCSSGPHHHTTPGAASPTASPPPSLASGIYTDDVPGTPHYFVTLKANQSNLNGTLGYEFQDGQTGDALTFTGSIQSGLATLTFQDGSTGTATVDPSGFELGECQHWMPRIATRTDCTFHRAKSIG